MAIEEDQLTRHKNETFGRITIEALKAVIEQLHQFARIRRGGSISELAIGVESDACFSGVGYDETHLGLLCQCHISLELMIRIKGTTNDIDAFQRIDSLPFKTTLQIDMIKTVLSIEHIYHTFSKGCTMTTEPLKSVFWFMFQTIQSTKALRKLPSPNWMIFLA